MIRMRIAKRTDMFLLLVLFGLLGCGSSLALGVEEWEPPRLDPRIEAQVQQVLARLPNGAMLRDALEAGHRGDGKRKRWMDAMQREGVRAALFRIRFEWDRRPKRFEVERLMCLADYSFREEDTVKEVELANATPISRTLDRALRKAGIEKAKEMMALWMKVEQRTRGSGQVFVMLFDDQWLPSMGAPIGDVDDPDVTDLMNVVQKCGLVWDDDGSRTQYWGHIAVTWPPPTPEEIEETHRRVEEAVGKLLSAGAKVNAKAQDGYAPLMMSVMHCPANIVSLLLHGGAEVNAKSHEKRTPLIIAAAHNRLDIVNILLEAGADPNVMDEDGTTALLEAIHKGNRETVHALLAAGANANEKDYAYGTLLIRAIRITAPSIVSALLAAGADPNAKDDSGSTPLIVATKYQNTQAIRAVIAAGADVNAKGKEGATALAIALRHGDPEIINLLRQAGATE